MKQRWHWALMCCAACGDLEPDVASTEQAIYGAEGDYEFAIDAPWRIEPALSDGTYDAIPITISLQDANVDDDNAVVTNGYEIWKGGLGRIKSLTVVEWGVGTFNIPLSELHEVERTIGTWKLNGPALEPELCRHWRGEDCTSKLTVTNTSDWHATLLYVPRGLTTPGRDVRLDFKLTVTQVNKAPSPINNPHPDVVLENQVNVHLGEAPLPRFDSGTEWAYGDLHYHAQGTDNEGESGYEYRNVIQAMGALGLDFALASEHASDSEQMHDFDIDGESFVHGLEVWTGDLRDMNKLRYTALWRWLHAPEGANRNTSSARRVASSRLRVPQIFLGGEVDVMPETPIGQYVIDYGNGLRFDIRSACARRTDFDLIPLLFDPCDDTSVRALTADNSRWIVRDPQSFTLAAARQHLLYLPHSATNEQGFISSHTTRYGGGSRRLRDLVHAEFEQNDQGDFFLAHPLDAADDVGTASLGPDIVPYSQVEYDDIFASEHFRGLQFWNSDTRRTTDASFGIDHLKVWNGNSVDWKNAPWKPGVFGELHHGAATWDRLLLMGMDANRTSAIPWLAPGAPRKLFMAGGSDAHGDLDFRRKGYMVLGPGHEDIDKVTDTAIGTPRNLVHVGSPQGLPLIPNTESRPFTQDQVFGAIARGDFSVTDGPALRIVWDTNGNRTFDDTDVPMGGDITFDPAVGPPALLVQWKSTPEFGDVDRVDLYVGVAAGARGQVYAPTRHGTRTPTGAFATANGDVALEYRDPLTSRTLRSLDDGYWQRDDLRITTTGRGQGGVQLVTIDPRSFPVATKGPRVCTVGAFGRKECFMRLENVVEPQQLYVRAFARTVGRAPSGGSCLDPDAFDSEPTRVAGRCLPRFAFTNPVWARPSVVVPPSTIVAANGLCLDTAGGASTFGTSAVVSTCSAVTSQRWQYDSASRNLIGLNGTRLDALGFSGAEGAPVGIWIADGAQNQEWTFRDVEVVGPGGKVLDITGTWEGASTVLATPTWTARRWTLTSAGEIRSSDNRCLDVYGHGTQDGATVLSYACYGTANQKWRVLPGGMLQGTESNKCLVADPSGSLVLGACSTAIDRRWAFRGPIRGWNDKCLDVLAGATGNATPVLLFTCHGGANQQFTVLP